MSYNELGYLNPSQSKLQYNPPVLDLIKDAMTSCTTLIQTRSTHSIIPASRGLVTARPDQTDWFTSTLQIVSQGLARICARNPIISLSFHLLGFDYHDPSDPAVIDWINDSSNGVVALFNPVVSSLFNWLDWPGVIIRAILGWSDQITHLYYHICF